VATANDRKQALLKIVKSAIQAMDPEAATKSSIRVEGDIVYLGKTPVKLGELGKLRILAIGKAALGMTRGAHAALSSIIEDTLVITSSTPRGTGFKILEGSHPLPDAASEKAGKAALEFVSDLGPNDRVLLLLSGGAATMVCAPPDGVDLKSKAKMTELLQRSGAPINDINVVRKHLSSIKGGFLLQATAPAQIVTMVISDIPNDYTDAIGAGLASYDSSTFAQALQIIERYDLVSETPRSVMTYLRAGAEGKVAETPKPVIGRQPPPIHIVRSPRDLVNAAARACEATGMAPQLPYPLADGPIEEVARRYGAWMHQTRSKLLQRPIVLVGAGEPRISVKGKNEGGRCQHLALLMVKYLDGDKGATFVAAATDGIDGHDKASGAAITDQTAKKARDKKLSPEKLAEKYDSYKFHNEMGTALPGKATETAVGDLHLLCLEPG
jgi:hydroxypyruvate reductase